MRDMRMSTGKKKTILVAPKLASAKKIYARAAVHLELRSWPGCPHAIGVGSCDAEPESENGSTADCDTAASAASGVKVALGFHGHR